MKRIILLFFLYQANSAKEVFPRLSCDTASSNPNTCYFKNLNFPRKEVTYKVNVIDSRVLSVREVFLRESTVPTLTSAFCESFHLMTRFDALAQGIEVILEDAFANCFNLEGINLERNFIQILPEKLFANNYKLNVLGLNHNKIIGILRNQFEYNPFLNNLILWDNHLSDFPVAAVSGTKLSSLRLNSNDIFDLNVAELVKLPYLKLIYLGGNIIPCPRLTQIVAQLNQTGIKINVEVQDPRQRHFRMGTTEGLDCVVT